MSTAILGIDISSQPGNTAACLLTVRGGRWIATAPCEGCDDKQLDDLIKPVDFVGIDAPFGWPSKFVECLGEWTYSHWDDTLRKELCFRLTDRRVQEITGGWPLSVAADKIAMPAMRTAAILNRHKVRDRSGGDGFFEVYPAGSLRQWNLPSRSYKKNTVDHAKRRKAILRGLRRKMPWLEIDDACLRTGDAIDSVIAAVTALAAACGLTITPGPAEKRLATTEGWIHLPRGVPDRPDGKVPR